LSPSPVTSQPSSILCRHLLTLSCPFYQPNHNNNSLPPRTAASNDEAHIIDIIIIAALAPTP
jgi:hypothetical protein